MKKIIIGVIISLFVLGIIAVVAVGLSLNRIVKAGVETVGPQVTKVDVKLDSVNLNLFSGSCTLSGLVVGNPPGYTSPQSIGVKRVYVSVLPSSVFSDKVVVKSIQVESPDITFEGGPTKNNLTDILNNVKGEPSTNAPASAGTNAPAASKKLQVDDFLLKDAKVHVAGQTLTIPDIHLTGLGQGPEGITAAELTKLVIAKVNSEVTTYVINKGLDELGKQAGKMTEDLGKKANESIQKGLDGLLKKKQ